MMKTRDEYDFEVVNRAQKRHVIASHAADPLINQMLSTKVSKRTFGDKGMTPEY